MILEVSHRTSYAYGQPVSIAHHLLHLAPRLTDRQEVRRFRLEIRPTPTLVRDAIDYFGNAMSVVTLEQEHGGFAVTALSTVEIRPRGLLEPERSLAISRLAGSLERSRDSDFLEVRQFLFESPAVRCPQEVHDWSAPVLAAGRPVLAAALELNGKIHRDFAYDARATTVGTSVAECFALRRGVCQDFAHLMLAALRSHRIPARYVSGYLLTHPPAGKPRLVGADASHAWVQVWAPPFGWVDLDPTNDVVPGEEHVTLAFGRDFTDVSPVNGVIFGGGAHTVDVQVDVAPVPAPA
jgi:transglutaminase-like putative cysteine protease